MSKGNTKKKASIKYMVPASTLNDRKKKENKYLKISQNQKNTSLYKGRKIKNIEVELQLIKYIEFNRKLFNSVTTWGLLLKLYNILPEKKELSINTKQNVYF